MSRKTSKTRKTLHHRGDYREHRGAAYPMPGDAFDAIMKGLAAYRDGKPLPADTIAWLDACAAVKARHPKPAA